MLTASLSTALRLSLLLPDYTVFEYVEPAPMGSEDPPRVVTTCNKAYDLEQVNNSFRGQFMGMAMVGVMHLYFGYTNPLLIQSIVPLKGALEGNLTKVWLYGWPAVGDLKRPWKGSSSGFPMNMSGGEIKTDKKSIEEAKKLHRGGVSKDD
jgi:Phosphate transport (Pho88)